MSGYYDGKPPWKAQGERQDGYDVLDPRDFRDAPPEEKPFSPYDELAKRIELEQYRRNFEQLQYEFDQADPEGKQNILNRNANSARAQDRDFARMLKAFQEGVE